MCNDFYVLETFGRSWVITRGREAAATLWKSITPNSWGLSLIYNAVAARIGVEGGNGDPILLVAWAGAGLGLGLA